MKKILILTVFILAFHSAGLAKTRVSDIGSHPYLSAGTFPQDLLQWQGNFFYYYPNYMKAPFWGDIDEPGNKPKITYLATGKGVVKGDANFEHKGAVHTLSNQAGFFHGFRENLVAAFQLEYTLDAMRNKAGGNMSNYNQDSSGTYNKSGYIPFDYFNGHTLNALNLQATTGFKLRNNPAGLRASVRYKNTLTRNVDFTYSKDGVNYKTERMVWGWDTKGCNHIFGAKKTEGDAWLQSSYGSGPKYTGDFQGSITLPLAKVGFQTQLTSQRQDQYRWVSDTTASTGDPALDKNFQGYYKKNDWSRKYLDGVGRVYSNLTFQRSPRHALNMWFSMGYGAATSQNALAANLSVEDDAKDKTRHMSMEAGPNLNIKLGDFFHYLDMALILEYGHTRYENTYERRVGRGRLEAFRNSSAPSTEPDELDEPANERFSYANTNFADIRADMSAMFPILQSSAGFLGFGPIILLETRYTFTTKYFGNSTDDGKKVGFDISAKRKNFGREFWFNSALMLQYMSGPMHMRLEITEPLLYSLRLRTRVLSYENDEDGMKERKPLWSAQEGLRIGFYVSRQMSLPFLR